jgi:hypothetical protein
MLRNLFDRFGPRPRVPSRLRCEDCRADLLAFMDADLPAERRRRVDEHLAECSACRAELASFRNSELALHSAAATIHSPGDLRPGFYARLEQSRHRQVPLRWGLAVPAVACALLAYFAAQHPAAVSGKAPSAVAVRRGTSPGANRSELSALPLTADSGAAAPSSRSNRRSGAQPGAEGSRRIVVRYLTRPNSRLALVQAHNRAERRMRRLIVRRTGQTPLQVALLGQVRERESVPAAAASTAAAAPASTGQIAEVVRRSGALEANPGDLAKAEGSGHVGLATLVTELHVSDDNRDFMASTHVDAVESRRDRREAVRVDDDNDSARESVELPALP